MRLAVVTTFAREIRRAAEAFLHAALCSSHVTQSKRSTWQRGAAQCGPDTHTETNQP